MVLFLSPDLSAWPELDIRASTVFVLWCKCVEVFKQCLSFECYTSVFLMNLKCQLIKYVKLYSSYNVGLWSSDQNMKN